ncbi:hypothetical protein MNBD_DELTA03-951 [hydrothermal vent metagenome]|uniref:PIN domain-containing protein n=1 Tax=hydrothermal vent metagenome TaxID=652676 RepID=A0A3B0W7C7_9ZZZZ
MKIIIDTHIFLWALADPARISSGKLRELENPANIIFVSSITVTEIMIKASIGKLQFDYNPLELAQQSGFESLEYTVQDALLLKDMPFHHKDPFDRMLICQSLNNAYPLMTDDSKIKRYNCRVI